jgi:hypothetical protein
MSLSDENTKRFAANSLFPSFLYAALGLVLGQAGAAQVHGSWGLHVFLGLPGLALSGLALFRARLHWPAAGADMPPLRARVLGWYLLLLAAGACIGVLVSIGSVLLLGIAAALTYLAPWTKIPACRAGFVVSSVVTLTGAIACAVTYGRPVHPLHFMVFVWMLYVPPMFMQFLVMASLDRGYRIHAPRVTNKPDLDVHVPLPQ